MKIDKQMSFMKIIFVPSYHAVQENVLWCQHDKDGYNAIINILRTHLQQPHHQQKHQEQQM